MTTRLWNYVSTVSNLSGGRLHQIYAKLKQEREAAARVGPSHMNGFAPGPGERSRGYKNETYKQTSILINRGLDTVKFEAWKRRRRAEADMSSQFQPPPPRPFSNGTRLLDPNSSGILGAGPSDIRHFADERPERMHQTGFLPR